MSKLLNIDYFGFVNGMIQTIIGHPLDTLKTWKQGNNFSNKKMQNNMRNLYRGIKYPLLTNSVLNHVQFNLMKMKINNYHFNYITTGIFSGVFLAPIEYYKIRHQNNLKINFPNGFAITILREIPGVYLYFGILRNFEKYTNIKSDLITGGFAGVISWFVTYPLDTIKTRIQSDIKFKNAIKMPLYNGLTYCLLRAFIANSLGFYCYVNLNKIFK